MKPVVSLWSKRRKARREARDVVRGRYGYIGSSASKNIAISETCANLAPFNGIGAYASGNHLSRCALLAHKSIARYTLLAYDCIMRIEFDPAKSAKNEADRGFGFAFAARVFLGQLAIFRDLRVDYGEARMVAVGEIDGKLYTVVYTDRSNVRRIISAHRASRQEKRSWPPSE